jgi:hypothetical protein
LDRNAVASMQRFLADGSVKVLGGARFDANRAVSPEWQPFGGYYMVLPSVEVVCSDASHAFIACVLVANKLGLLSEARVDCNCI